MTNMVHEDSPYAMLLQARSSGDLEAIKDGEARVLRGYLLTIRELFRSSPLVRAALSAPANERHEKVQAACALGIEAQAPEIWMHAVDVLLEEHDRLVAGPTKEYLVDQNTGLATIPLVEGSIFQPKDYVGEDGQLHKASPILDPGKSSALGLIMQDRARTQTALSTHSGLAYEHLRNSSSILEVAREHLEEAGVREGPCEGHVRVVEVGREQVDGVLQAPNPAFHRSALFGELLARKIAAFRVDRCELLDITLEQTGKQRWYAVAVRVPEGAVR